MCAIGSIVRMIPPRTSPSRTTTPTLQSTGRCRSRRCRTATRLPEAGPICSRICRDPSHRIVENTCGLKVFQMRQLSKLLGEAVDLQPRLDVFLVQLGGAI